MQPYNNQDLYALYAKTEKRQRDKRVKEIVETIYNEVIAHATEHPERFYYHLLPSLIEDHAEQRFYMANMREIVGNLEFLFPQAHIQQRTLMRFADGTLHRCDPHNPYVVDGVLGHRGEHLLAIIIDWSRS